MAPKPADAKAAPAKAAPADEVDELAVDALPTKDFFVYMLTKDIDLAAAIIDLLDNSVDGALRLKPHRDFKGLAVEITTTPEEFVIKDNCGGIDLETARKVAFRLGRPPDSTGLTHSVGQFGVGMKRAFFKIGNVASVDSTHAKSRFQLTLKVDKWRAAKDKDEKDDWGLQFDEEPEERNFDAKSQGTTVRVTELHDGVKKDFADIAFKQRLFEQVAAKHTLALLKGISITCNKVEVKSRPLTVLASKEIIPVRQKFALMNGKSKVDVEIICGVLDQGDDNVQNAGWYVYCNQREILHADRSYVTGWGEGSGKVIPAFEEKSDEVPAAKEGKGGKKAKKIPQFHNQFSTFRGYVLLDADDGSALPWTTTKTTMDMNSPIYQQVRQRMVMAMRPVIDFQNAVDRENNRTARDRPLTNALKNAKATDIHKVGDHEIFDFPAERKLTKSTKYIRYWVDKEDYEAVKATIKDAEKPGDVGEHTFEYYREREVK